MYKGFTRFNCINVYWLWLRVSLHCLPIRVDCTNNGYLPAYTSLSVSMCENRNKRILEVAFREPELNVTLCFWVNLE